MRANFIGGLVALAIIAVLAAYGSLFTVYQTKQALVVRFGEPVRIIKQPGLHVQYPLVETVAQVDNRILALEHPAQPLLPSHPQRLPPAPPAPSRPAPL